MHRFLFALLLSATSIWAAEVRELTWREMVPSEAQVPPLQTTPVQDLSTSTSGSDTTTPQQSPGTLVVKALDGQLVKLPGYIVPLDVDQEGRINGFLLVPLIGACIHAPPPAPNQIVYVTSETGVLIDDIYEPFWIEGRMQVKDRNTELAELASASYQITASKIYLYNTAN